jgi:PAS domain S-box-containing protein
VLETPSVAWLVALATTLAIAIGIGVRAYRSRDRPGATALAVEMVAITIWCGAYALQLLATTESAALTFLRVEYLGTVFVSVTWLVFVLEYTGRDDLVTRQSVAALCVIPVLTIVAVWTNPLHHVMWTERTVAGAGGLGASTLNAGFWVYFAYAYFLLAGSLWFLVTVVADPDSPHRTQAGALVVATLIPVAVQVVHIVGPAWAPTVNPTSFSFVLSGGIAIAAIERFSLLESNPVTARVADERVVEELEEGVLVVDETGTIVDANPTAEALLDDELASIRGQQVGDCLPTLSSIPDIAEFGAETTTLSVDGSERHVKVSASPVETSRGKRSGWVVTIADMTPELRRQQRTEVLNRVLRETLRDEMDVVSSRATDAAYATETDDQAATADIREHARQALAVGDVAEEFEALLDESSSAVESVDVVPVVQAEADAIRETFPSIDVRVDAPLGEWAYCGGLFEPTCRALLRFGANREAEATVEATADGHGDGAGGDGELAVVIEVLDETAVRVSLRLAAGTISPAHERLLEDGVDSEPDVDLDSPDELSCWLVHWGVERLGGSVAVDGDVVSLRLPRRDDPDD